MQKKINALLNFSFSFAFANKKRDFFLFPVICCAFTALVAILFFSTVNLKPTLGSNFFFSSDDPQMQDEQKIQKLFKQDPQIIFSIKGDIQSALYYARIEKITEELLAMDKVIGAQSLSEGPKDFQDALNGPLWSRVIVSKDQQSTLIPIFVDESVSEDFIRQIESLAKKHEQPDFEILISGAPYIVELLKRSLFKDVKVFSAVAFLFFGFLFIFFFRSWRVLFSMLVTCANTSMLTLIAVQTIGVEMGMLTANLSTIVFVLTLSHIIFIVFNWNSIVREDEQTSYIYQALVKTLPASFWSMLTTFLGFLSLIWVKATPLKQLGYAGSIGTIIAFFGAYLFFSMMFPLSEQGLKAKEKIEGSKKLKTFFVRRHPVIFILLVLVVLGFASGISAINTDPSLLAYFKEGSEIKKGLQYIDDTGGSSPLFIVATNTNDESFSEEGAYQKLLNATRELEKDDEVGSAVSLPIIIEQAEESFLARLLKMDWLIGILSSERFGKVAQYFITADHQKALIMLRMRESGRDEARIEVINRLEDRVRANDLNAYLIGGVYSLQGRMSALVKSSLISGLSFLLILFVAMAWVLSRSWNIAISVFFSLLMIPVSIIGLLGIFGVPLDIISAPAVNISIGMAVDAMIHMIIYIKKHNENDKLSWSLWKETLNHYWKPVLYTTIIVGGGFGIFGLSGFPPTQRFGMMVLMGAIMSTFVALIAFPFLATLTLPSLRRKKVEKVS